MRIHAWLEEREIPGLQRAFRGQLKSPSSAGVGVGSVHELHRAIDDTLREAGLIDGRADDHADRDERR